MDDGTLIDAGLLSADRLTTVLRDRGVLPSGKLNRIEIGAFRGEGATSRLHELRMEYSGDVDTTAPRKCLVKSVKPGFFWAAEREAEFYDLAAAGLPVESVPQTFGSILDGTTETGIILMEDLGSDFHTTKWPVPPAIEVCDRAVRGLASAHAKFWGSEVARLEEIRNGKTASEKTEDFMRFARRLANNYPDAISKERVRMIDVVCHQYPEKLSDHIGVTNRRTIVHGDAHFWNFLVPTDKNKPVSLIDWQAWKIDLPAFDLAYMISLHWFLERRQRYEKRLLEIYLETINAKSIPLKWDELWYDYRLATAGMMLYAIWISSFAPAEIWWPHIDRAFSAFEDLECAEIL